MNTTKSEKTYKEIVIGRCWEYLDDNFHKFSEANKIRICLALVQKDIPTKMEGAVTFNRMPSVKINDKPLEVNIGNLGNPVDSGDSGQASPDNNTDK